MDRAPERRRNTAVGRAQEQREFYRQVIIWVIIYVQFSGIWLLTDQEQFWPVWSMLAWGAALAFQALNVFYANAHPDPKHIDKELSHGRPPGDG